MIRKLYAHSLIALYFFVFMEPVAYIAIVGMGMGSALDDPYFNYPKYIVSNVLLMVALFPVLRSHFPEMKYWFGIYGGVLFFLRFYFSL